MAKLEILTGDYAGQSFALDAPLVRLGSDARCDICLKEPGISRLHIEIGQDDDGGYWVEDAGGSFGTQLNGRDTERETLFGGDTLTLGRVKVRFSLDGNKEGTAPNASAQEGTQHLSVDDLLEESSLVSSLPASPSATEKTSPQATPSTSSLPATPPLLSLGPTAHQPQATSTSISAPSSATVVTPRHRAQGQSEEEKKRRYTNRRRKKREKSAKAEREAAVPAQHDHRPEATVLEMRMPQLPSLLTTTPTTTPEPESSSDAQNIPPQRESLASLLNASPESTSTSSFSVAVTPHHLCQRIEEQCRSLHIAKEKIDEALQRHEQQLQEQSPLSIRRVLEQTQAQLRWEQESLEKQQEQWRSALEDSTKLRDAWQQLRERLETQEAEKEELQQRLKHLERKENTPAQQGVQPPQKGGAA